MAKKIVVIPGDGIGEEITSSAVQVLKKIDEKFALGLEFTKYDAGGTAYDKFGTPLPQETIDACKAADGVLFGAVGGDKWDNVEPALRPEKAILGLRKALGLYANLRPVKVADALVEYSPLKPELVKGVDLVIVRELIGGIYFGDKCESEIHEGQERAWDLENYSVPEVDRIGRLAFETARLRRGKVTSVDKANVLATSRLWREVVTKLHKSEYSDVQLDYLFVDNAAMQLVTAPGRFDVILTENMFGDIISDEASVIGGSIGLLPSASIGEDNGLFEPIHGSYPQAKGKGIANPIASILSAAMLLDYLELDQAADKLRKSVEHAIESKFVTIDLNAEQHYTTSEVGDFIADYIKFSEKSYYNLENIQLGKSTIV